MKTLLNYQQDFYKAIFTNDPLQLQNAIGEIDGLEERFKIYSNNVFASLKSVLNDDFPFSRTYVGDQKFNQSAFEFVRNFPPTSGCLLEYGARFPEVLEALCPSCPGIKDIAQLEWQKKKLQSTKNSAPLDPQSMHSFQPEEVENLVFDFPDATFFHSSEFYLQEFWQACEQKTPYTALKQGPTFSLLIRPNSNVAHYWLSQEEYVFLTSLHKNITLGEAYEKALSIVPEFDLMTTLNTTFERNYFIKTEIKK